MEQYIKPEMEIIEFDVEDVITSSGLFECQLELPVDVWE